jgi:3-mercaptopyruvate sulfurtransferase SseA
VALLLRKRGITRVRPLLGGFEAWQEKGFPVGKQLVQLPGSPGSGQSVGKT